MKPGRATRHELETAGRHAEGGEERQGVGLGLECIDGGGGPAQWRPGAIVACRPRRMAVARIDWPSGWSVSKHCPTSNRATSP